MIMSASLGYKTDSIVAYSLFLLPLLFMLLHMFLFCNVVLRVLNSYENTVLMKRERWLL